MLNPKEPIQLSDSQPANKIEHNSEQSDDNTSVKRTRNNYTVAEKRFLQEKYRCLVKKYRLPRQIARDMYLLAKFKFPYNIVSSLIVVISIIA